jgi:hypothetical protein
MVPFVANAARSRSYALVYSTFADRSAPVALSGSQVHGDIYVFVTPGDDITKATYRLDDPNATGGNASVEEHAPFDFMGTDTAGVARPWESGGVQDGTHSITVDIQSSSGNQRLTMSFAVANGAIPWPTAAPSSNSTASITATATATPATGPTLAPTTGPTTAPTNPPTPAPTAVPAPTALPSGFIGSSGTQFVLGGRPFIFSGFNIYQANSRSNCSYSMGNGGALDTALTDIGPGAEVFRAWFFQRLATTNGRRDWSAFDHTLAVAKAHGVKVIVTLANQWGSCESPSSGYKSDAWYTGGYKTDVLPQNIVPYRQYVQEIVSRYKNDPTIAMWQLMNEAEIKASKSSGCSPTADLYNFAADVSGLIKSIDPNHLVSLGTMGAGQCGSQGSDYKWIHSISTIDVCEYHDYGHETQSLPAHLASDIAACKSLNKPIFVGESGIMATSVGGTLAARAAAFKAKRTAMLSAGVGGFLVWSWNNKAPTTNNWPVGPGDPTIRVIDGY